MIGKDLVKYHNYVHSPMHYTTSVDAIGTPLLSAYGLSTTAKLTAFGDTKITELSGSATDYLASQESPFLGHMFIQGCVSASGWLSDDGTCVKLAKVQPPSGCNRGVDLCGDHMKGALHMSHLNLTTNPDLTGYDFRNGEINLALDKSTFKTVMIDFKRPFSSVLHIQPTNIKPGCVSTIRFVFPGTMPKGYCKLTFHPGMKWLTNRPTYVTKDFSGYISLESYGDTVDDVYCSFREECFIECPEPVCRTEGLSGFDTIDGDEDTSFAALSTQELSGCPEVLKFIPWVDDCNVTYTYELTSGAEHRFYYRFDDFYFDEGGTRLWEWTGEKDAITGIPIGHWYYSESGVNHFRFKTVDKKYSTEWVPNTPTIKIYRGDYNDKTDTPILSTLIYNSNEILREDDPLVTYLPLEKEHAVKFTKESGSRYLVRVICPPSKDGVKGTFKMTCPFRYIASRYVPK